MYLTFTTAGHNDEHYAIDLSNNLDANCNVDVHDLPNGYTGDWTIDKANGDYTQVTFLCLVTASGKNPNN